MKLKSINRIRITDSRNRLVASITEAGIDCIDGFLAHIYPEKPSNLNWKEIRPEDKLIWYTEAFDGVTKENCVAKKVFKDHVIAESDSGLTLWIDEDTQHMFYQRGEIECE